MMSIFRKMLFLSVDTPLPTRFSRHTITLEVNCHNLYQRLMRVRLMAGKSWKQLHLTILLSSGKGRKVSRPFLKQLISENLDDLESVVCVKPFLYGVRKFYSCSVCTVTAPFLTFAVAKTLLSDLLSLIFRTRDSRSPRCLRRIHSANVPASLCQSHYLMSPQFKMI